MTGSEFLSDGAMPCGPCSRSHAYAVKNTPALAPPEPECTYDDPDVIAEGPKGKIARLESEIGTYFSFRAAIVGLMLTFLICSRAKGLRSGNQ